MSSVGEYRSRTPAAAPVTSRAVELPALKLVQSSLVIRRLANLTLVLLGLAIAGMMFLPWQQSARGTGNVTAFVPQERQQTVMSAVNGIVDRVDSALREGDRVTKGQIILELTPVAENLAEQYRSQLQDLTDKMKTAETKAGLYGQQVKDFSDARDFAVQAAEELVKEAEAKLQGATEVVEAYRSKEWQAKRNFDRQERLFQKGIKPEKEIEKLKKDYEVAAAELNKAERDVIAAAKYVEAKRQEREQKLREAETKVKYAQAMQQDAMGMQNTTRKEMRELEVKLSELDRMVIRAPRDGTIFRMPIFERGQAISKGYPLFTIVPETDELAVELWVSGIDAPLVQKGDHVRLQFEGWPAVQFAGWPSVAVGTFGGKVASIDQTDDGKGKFRLQVRPDPSDQAWPKNRFLRQGVRANGWVMLQRVPLGYEIWRQLNGFPPVVAEEEPKSDKDAKKTKVKLPK